MASDRIAKDAPNDAPGGEAGDTYPWRRSSVTVPLPDDGSRWRCAGCGNLTRFDVTRTLRRREYWHFDLAGVPAIDEAETLGERVETVRCRWCGRSDAITLVARPTTPGDGAET